MRWKRLKFLYQFSLFPNFYENQISAIISSTFTYLFARCDIFSSLLSQFRSFAKMEEANAEFKGQDLTRYILREKKRWEKYRGESFGEGEVYRTSEVSLRGISVSSLTRRSHDSCYFPQVVILSRKYWNYYLKLLCSRIVREEKNKVNRDNCASETNRIALIFSI